MGKMFLDRSNINILDPNILFVLNTKVSVIANPLVQAIIEQFLLARATFRSVLASESHWLQHCTSLCTHHSLLACTSKCGWAINQ